MALLEINRGGDRGRLVFSSRRRVGLQRRMNRSPSPPNSGVSVPTRIKIRSEVTHPVRVLGEGRSGRVDRGVPLTTSNFWVGANSVEARSEVQKFHHVCRTL